MKYAISIAAVAAALFVFWPHHQQPTPDQLYGCTIQQQAPNGDCP